MLADALVRALRDAALVVVQAPAGFGKTTSVRAALSGEADVAWYDAQPWEAEAFVAPLLERVRAVRPDAGRLTLALAQRGAEPERLGATLAGELQHVAIALRIVVDDAHVLGPSFAAFARSLVQRMPDTVRVVLLARTPIDVGLPEAVAAGRGALIDATALRFGVAETRALARSFGVTLDDAAAAALVQRTEGWPIAIALALRAPSSSESLLDELVARRIAALDAADSALLEATVAYEIVEPAILASDDAAVAARFAALARDASLVDAVRPGYRVHPLVREALARRIGAEALAERHADAARTYIASGRLRPALYHLERAHDLDVDVVFLRRHAASAVASGLTDGVRASLARVRAAPGAPDALIGLVDGLLAKARGDDGRDEFTTAARVADAAGDTELAFEARLQAIEADLAHGATVTRARIDDLLVRAAEHGPAARTKAVVRAGWADAVAGDFAGALARIDGLPDPHDPAVAADIAPLAAYAHIALGDFEAGERIATELIERWAASDDLVRYSGALVWAARFALLRGDAIAAYELAREGARIAAPFALRAEAAALHATLAEAALDVGEVTFARSEARAALRTADAAWYARDAARSRTLAKRILARADALEGNLAAAIAQSDDDEPIALADLAVFAAVGREADAATRRERARAAVGRATPSDGADAVALWCAAAALDLLDPSRTPASRTELRAGPFEGLIARRIEQQKPAGIAALVGTLTGRRADRRAAPEPPLETLTAREHEILQLLASGLTNREIAQRLIVSARTVETHVARITGKLGVNSRARAVARAVALGIVSPPAA